MYVGRVTSQTRLGAAPPPRPALPRGRRSEDARDRRAEIVRAALSVLGRRGYADTALRQIATEAGVAQGLVHYYFSSKEDLLIAVAEEIETQLAEAWGRAVRGSDDPLERIVAGLDAADSRFAQRPELWRTLLDLYVLSLSNPAIRRRCQLLRGRLVEEVEAEVRPALGRLPAYSVASPGDLAAAITAAIEGIAMAALLEGRDPSAHFRALKVMLLSLVVTAHVAAGREPPLQRLTELARPR